MKEDEIVRACDLHSNKTVTLSKHVAKYKHMRKWMVEFLSKSESRGVKIDRGNSIRITKLSIYFNFLRDIPLGDVINMTRILMRSPANVYSLIAYSVKHGVTYNITN